MYSAKSSWNVSQREVGRLPLACPMNVDSLLEFLFRYVESYWNQLDAPSCSYVKPFVHKKSLVLDHDIRMKCKRAVVSSNAHMFRLHRLNST